MTISDPLLNPSDAFGMAGRYATYVDLAHQIRARFVDPDATLRELFSRIEFNICLADGGLPERTVTVRHADKTLHTLAIDLSGPPDSVNSAINETASWIAGRARRVSG